MTRGYRRSRSRSHDRYRSRRHSYRSSSNRESSPRRRYRSKSSERHRRRPRYRHNRGLRSERDRSSSSDQAKREGCKTPPEKTSKVDVPNPPKTEKEKVEQKLRRDVTPPSRVDSISSDRSNQTMTPSPNKLDQTQGSSSNKEQDKSPVANQTHWKGFPVPKFYKNLKKYYDPISTSGDDYPPSLYFPLDGPKLRRYKNYKCYKDPLSKFNDEETWRNDLKSLIKSDFEYIKKRIELSELEVEMGSLVPQS